MVKREMVFMLEVSRAVSSVVSTVLRVAPVAVRVAPVVVRVALVAVMLERNLS